MPVWVPEIQAGYPLIANAIQSFFYVPHVLLRQVFSGFWVANLSLLLHIFLAGVGMMIFLRSLGFRQSTVLMGSLLFAGGGYFIGRITLPHLFFPAAWIPLILWAQIRAIERPAIEKSLLFAVLVSAQIFSGHIQMFVYTIIIMFIVGISYLIKNASFTILRSHWHFFLAPFVVIVLTAVNIVPTIELLPQSKRTGALIGPELLDISYPPSQLLAFVFPRIYGFQDTYKGAKNEPELMEYVGWIGLLAGIIGICSGRTWRHPVGISGLTLVLIGFLLAGGDYSPFFHFIVRTFSFWAQFANPGRALVLVHVGWVILAAFGLDRLRLGRWQSSLAVIFIAGELLFWGYGVNKVTAISAWQRESEVLRHVPARTDAPRIFSDATLNPRTVTDFSPTVGPALTKGVVFEQKIVPQQDNWKGGTVGLTWNTKTARADGVSLQIVDDTGAIVREIKIPGSDIKNGESISFAFPPIQHSKGNTFFVRIASSHPSSEAPHIIMFTNFGGFDYNPTGDLSLCTLPTCTAITSPDWNANADLDLQLFYVQPALVTGRELLSPILGEGAGLKMVRGHLTLQIGRMYRYMRAFGERGDFVDSRLISHRNFLNRLSAGTLIASYPEHRSIEGLEAVTSTSTFPVENGYAKVYTNDEGIARMRLYHAVRHSGSEEETLQLLSSDSLSEQEVVVEKLPSNISFEADETSSIRVIRDDYKDVTVAVRTTRPQIFVLRDAMYSGWHAFLNEQEVPIYAADSVFRGVVIPEGEHTISFQYIPNVYYYSALVSALAWIVVASFLSWKIRSALMQKKK